MLVVDVLTMYGNTLLHKEFISEISCLVMVDNGLLMDLPKACSML
ncbi:hypothetical protein PG1821B_1631 [Bifidobacterium animalis subsp. lactis]|nr:hypothetical protein PG1821B_1631 [Bifidobacterium animalis subsp. lactis]